MSSGWVILGLALASWAILALIITAIGAVVMAVS